MCALSAKTASTWLPAVVGRTMRLDNHPVPNIGVAQRGFFGVNVGDDREVAVPLQSIAVLRSDRNP